MLGLGIISPLLPGLARKLGASGLWIGIIFAGYVVSRAAVMPYFGKLSDKSGRKKFITLGLFLYIIVSFLFVIANNIYFLTAVRIFQGIAAGLILPSVMAYIGDYIKEGHEAFTMSILNMVLYIGIGAGPFIGGMINFRYGYDSVFITMGLLSLLAFLVVLIFLPEAEIKSEKQKPRTFSEIINFNLVRAILIIIFSTSAATTLLMSFFPIMAFHNTMDIKQIGIIISAGIIISGLLQPPLGWMVDKIKNKEEKLKHAITNVLLGSAVISACLILLVFLSSFNASLIISMIFGLGVSIVIASVMGLTVMVGQKLGMGYWMGIFSSSKSVSMALTPLAAGLIMDFFGIKAAFYVIALAPMCGAFLAAYYMKKRVDGFKKVYD